jgi:hypothetical protein
MTPIDLSPRILLVLSAAAVAALTGLQAHAECVGTNTCFGLDALALNVDGEFNSAFGVQALLNNVNGRANSAFGFQALQQNVGSPPNTVPGLGSFNTAVGFQALLHTISGFDNTATGAAALHFNVTGDGNTANGARALSRNQGGGDNTAVGAWAMEKNVHGENNTAVGVSSLRNNIGSLHNTAIGFGALFNAGGGGNTAVGSEALAGSADETAEPTTGTLNTAVGWLSLAENDSGSHNTASGYRSLETNTSGSENAAFGVNALQDNTSGGQNTASGNGALRNNAEGSRNVALGYRAGLAMVNGNDNIFIGAYNIGKARDTATIRIGSASQKKAFIAGISGVKTGLSAAQPVFIDANGQLGTIKSSARFKEDIQPLGSVSERLYALRPVTFRYKEPDDDGTRPVQFGLVAEQVADVFPELVIYDRSGNPETVSYHMLSSLLVNELQSQKKASALQASRIAALESQISELVELKAQLSRKIGRD